MLHAFSRSERLLGRNSIEKLRNSRVAVFGIGGVGSFAVEGLVRSGVGKFVLVDDDAICLTNLNRQLHATRRTIGMAKVDVMRDRILDINPQAEVTVFKKFYVAGDSFAKRTSRNVDLSAEQILTFEDLMLFHHTPGQAIEYILDAIDTVTAKLDLIVRADESGIPVISCMGAGNKLDPTRLEVADIYETTGCPLARVMRQELRKRDIKALKVIYSKEEALIPIEDESTSCNLSCVCPKGSTRTCTIRHSIPGSVAFVPSVAGMIMAGEVIKDLLSCEQVN